MTMPLRPGRPGRSEMSHGRSRYAHPQSDYTHPTLAGLGLAASNGEDKVDRQLARSAELRSDPTNSAEDLTTMFFVEGNPDMYGPDEKIIQERKQVRPSSYKQPQYRTGVIRQK